MADRRMPTETGRTIVDMAESPGSGWKDLLATSPHATFCHWPAWDGILEDVMGADCRWLEARNGEGRLLGGMPLARVRSRIFGDYLVSMPFLSYGGPVGDEEVQPLLVDRALAFAKAEGVDSMELRARHRVQASVPVQQRRITVVLPLPESSENLWDSFKSKVRSQIRRPMKEGMEARFGTDQVPAFFEVFARNMRDLGTPSLPARWFERLASDFADTVVFGVVWDGDRPVAGGCGFHAHGELEITWASALREWNAKAPNMLLYWAFMEQAIERGASAFNFGRCAEGGGTHRFKLQWGSHDEPLPWLRWPEDEGDAPPGAGDARFALASETWKRLPVRVTTRVGPWLARKIP